MKSTLFWTGLFAIGAFILSGIPALAADGAEAFKANKCYTCHGPDGRGDDNPIGGAPPLKGGSFVKNSTDEDIAEVIRNGRDFGHKEYDTFMKRMPKFGGKMSDEEINALARWLKQG
jgi:mono/diheme cytochrome c family protein